MTWVYILAGLALAAVGARWYIRRRVRGLVQRRKPEDLRRRMAERKRREERK